MKGRSETSEEKGEGSHKPRLLETMNSGLLVKHATAGVGNAAEPLVRSTFSLKLQPAQLANSRACRFAELLWSSGCRPVGRGPLWSKAACEPDSLPLWAPGHGSRLMAPTDGRIAARPARLHGVARECFLR